MIFVNGKKYLSGSASRDIPKAFHNMFIYVIKTTAEIVTLKFVKRKLRINKKRGITNSIYLSFGTGSDPCIIVITEISRVYGK